MRNLTGLKNVAIRLIQHRDIFSYTDMVERLERQVIALLQSEVLKSHTQTVSIFVLFGNAALLHIYMFIRDFPQGLPLIHRIAARIRTSIDNADMSYLHKEYPEMMLWILMMGGLGSAGTPNRGWYANLLAEACMASKHRGANAVVFGLTEFLWSESYRSPHTMGFWNDVAKVQGLDGGYDVRRLTDDISVEGFNLPPNLIE
jgi:hypothetical protein